LHLVVLGGLGRPAGVEPPASALEVFTVEPEPEPTISPAAAPAPRIARSARPRPARVSPPRSSVVQPAVCKPAPKALVLSSPVIPPPSAEGTPDMLRDGLARGPEELQGGTLATPLTPAKTLTAVEPPPATIVASDSVVMHGDTQLPSTPDSVPEREPVAAQPAPPRRSTLGLGLGRLQIRLDGARERTTSREIDVISGTVIGGEARSLQVQVGEAVTTPALDGRAFSAAVSLKPGLNHVRVVAADAQGGAVEETLTVQYNAPIRLVITSPPDGHTQTLDDPPLVVVQGEVDDPSVSSVWLVAGERRFAVPVTAGRFRHTVPVLEPTVRVRVETPPLDNRSAASATVNVHAAATPTIALLLHWPSDAVVPVEVGAAWRARADRADGSLQRVALSVAQQDKRLTIFYVRNPHPGVYTFVLRSPAGAPQPVQPALYVPSAGAGLRTLSPVTLNGSERVLLARVLMPQGILWEQDDWFTGQSASGDTVTKFRFPDGISWTERMGASP
jgi:hypothetical protein